jgi:hypothetical protein
MAFSHVLTWCRASSTLFFLFLSQSILFKVLSHVTIGSLHIKVTCKAEVLISVFKIALLKKGLNEVILSALHIKNIRLTQ